MRGPPKIAVTGSAGQLARALVGEAQRLDWPLSARGRAALDLTSIDSVARFLVEERPDAVINTAAYTAVDKAESEPDQASALNAGAPALLATLCAHFNIPLVHLSTDYVFDGASRTPYREDDRVAPLNIYGASKAAGETAVRAAHPRHIIVRTSWVYAASGRNFLLSMLRLGASREVVRVVGDQSGSPTFAGDLARGLLSIADHIVADGSRISWGTYHLAGGGDTTWHGFAAEIFRIAAERGGPNPRLEEIATADYPAPAVRPRYSVLDTSKIESAFGIRMPGWRQSLANCMNGMDLSRPEEEQA